MNYSIHADTSHALQTEIRVTNDQGHQVSSAVLRLDVPELHIAEDMPKEVGPLVWQEALAQARRLDIAKLDIDGSSLERAFNGRLPTFRNTPQGLLALTQKGPDDGASHLASSPLDAEGRAGDTIFQVIVANAEAIR